MDCKKCGLKIDVHNDIWDDVFNGVITKNPDGTESKNFDQYHRDCEISFAKTGCRYSFAVRERARHEARE
jgi:hypothetical protein